MEEQLAPTVRYEPCVTFLADHDSAWSLCHCGWAEDEHPGPEPRVDAEIVAVHFAHASLRRAS